MAYSNSKITAPVSFSDVNQALGTSHTDLGSLCKDSHINMWAKYKPIKLAQRSTMSQWDSTNQTWLSTANWFRGTSGTCGFTPYSTTSLSDIISNTTGGMNGWTYNGTPTGGASEPFRLTDFAGYNHNANQLFRNFACNTEIKAGGSFRGSCMINVDGSDALVLADILVNNNNLYFGIIITNSSGTILKQCTNQIAGEAGVQITFPTSIGVGNEYRCYPFLATNPITLDGTVGSNTFYTCPMLSYATFNVVSHYQNLDVTINAAYNLGSHTSLTVEITNNESYALSNNVIYILPYTASNWDNPPAAVGQAVASQTLSSIDSGMTRFGTFNVTQGSYFAYITLDNNAEWRKANIMEEIDPNQ